MNTVQIEGLRTTTEVGAAARSALYLRLADGFAFPSEDLVQAVRSGRFFEDMRSELEGLPYAVEAGEALLDHPAAGSMRAQELDREYIRLFEVGPGGPPCSLYEGPFRSGRLKIMEELVRFFEHFGVQHQPGDQPDHLCCELEFMHYLTFKEAAALASGGPEQSFVLAQRDFLERHLRVWLPRLKGALGRLEPPPFYDWLAVFADEFTAQDLNYVKSTLASAPQAPGAGPPSLGSAE
jgi:DMSO reductase family type II enzyme chaperone